MGTFIVVENVLKTNSELLFGFGVKGGQQQDEEFLDKQVFWGLELFGEVVAEPLDQ